MCLTNDLFRGLSAQHENFKWAVYKLANGVTDCRNT